MLARSNRPSTMKALARTPQANPAEPLNNLLSIMGKMTPPIELPQRIVSLTVWRGRKWQYPGIQNP